MLSFITVFPIPQHAFFFLFHFKKKIKCNSNSLHLIVVTKEIAKKKKGGGWLGMNSRGYTSGNNHVA